MFILIVTQQPSLFIELIQICVFSIWCLRFRIVLLLCKHQKFEISIKFGSRSIHPPSRPIAWDIQLVSEQVLQSRRSSWNLKVKVLSDPLALLIMTVQVHPFTTMEVQDLFPNSQRNSFNSIIIRMIIYPKE